MKRKLMKAITIIPVVCTLLNCNAMTAGAVKNDWDSSWNGSINATVCSNSYCSGPNDAFGTNQKCSVRDKGDTSSIYVYNQSANTAQVTVWGEASWLSIHYFDPTHCSGYTTISTNKWSVPSGSQRFIPQYIGERTDLLYAHVHFTTYNTYGLWSADSSGWYPNANPVY